MLKSKFNASIFAFVAIMSVAKAQAANVEPIICEESGGAINSSEETEDSGVTFGKITIQFDQKQNPTSVTVERIATPEMVALNLGLNLKNARISKATIPHVDDAWGIESHEQVTAIGADGSSVVINLDDHRYAGILSGSTVEIKKGNQKVSTTEIEHQVICLTPSAKAQFEKDMNGAIE